MYDNPLSLTGKDGFGTHNAQKFHWQSFEDPVRSDTPQCLKGNKVSSATSAQKLH